MISHWCSTAQMANEWWGVVPLIQGMQIKLQIGNICLSDWQKCKRSTFCKGRGQTSFLGNLLYMEKAIGSIYAKWNCDHESLILGTDSSDNRTANLNWALTVCQIPCPGHHMEHLVSFTRWPVLCRSIITSISQEKLKFREVKPPVQAFAASNWWMQSLNPRSLSADPAYLITTYNMSHAGTGDCRYITAWPQYGD
jgi:hypothetical protein